MLRSAVIVSACLNNIQDLEETIAWGEAVTHRISVDDGPVLAFFLLSNILYNGGKGQTTDETQDHETSNDTGILEGSALAIVVE